MKSSYSIATIITRNIILILSSKDDYKITSILSLNFSFFYFVWKYYCIKMGSIKKDM